MTSYNIDACTLLAMQLAAPDRLGILAGFRPHTKGAGQQKVPPESIIQDLGGHMSVAKVSRYVLQTEMNGTSESTSYMLLPTDNSFLDVHSF